MASNELNNLGLEELKQKRVKAKNSLGAGIGAWIAFSLVLIVADFLYGKLSGTLIIQNLLVGSVMFGIVVWLSYNKLRNIDTELESRER